MAVTDRERWENAAPHVAMALCEAGYPTEVDDGGLLFFADETPDDVLVKACELAGVGDLVESLTASHCNCHDGRYLPRDEFLASVNQNEQS